MVQDKLVIKMLLGNAYFNGPREIFGYIRIDPNVTFDSFVEEHIEEVTKVIFDMDSVEESFNKYPAFTEEESKEVFANRPESLAEILDRLEEYKTQKEDTTIKINDDGEIVVIMSFGEGVVVEGVKKTMGCLKMDPEMTCEKFIKTKFDYFTRKTFKVETIKKMFETHPAFTKEDCEYEFKNEPKALIATLARLAQFSKQDTW